MLCHQWAGVISKRILDSLGCEGVFTCMWQNEKIKVISWVFYKSDFIECKGKPFILYCYPSDLLKVKFSPFFYGKCLFIKE